MRYNPKKHHLPVCGVSGILTVDKPPAWTSFDVVNFVRSFFNVPKVGHCGTLDPAATGLLVLVLGKFTVLSNRFSGDDKTYAATLRLGMETDSFDLDGAVVAEKGIGDLTEEAAKSALLSFVGESMQTPPMVSAVKVGGKKLYELARKGLEVPREARPIVISAIRPGRVALPEIDFELDCSKGTYVRALCHDVGEKLHCGGVLAKLRRLRSGRFTLAHAVTIDELKTFDQEKFVAHVGTLTVAAAGKEEI